MTSDDLDEIIDLDGQTIKVPELPEDLFKIPEAEARELYELVRANRPPWRKLRRKEKDWWLGHGRDYDDFYCENGGAYQYDVDAPFGARTIIGWSGEEFAFASLLKKRRELEAKDHRPMIVPARITRQDGLILLDEVITYTCNSPCNGCEYEAAIVADEFMRECVPQADPTVHETTLGRLRMDLVPDFSQIPGHQAVELTLIDERLARDFSPPMKTRKPRVSVPARKKAKRKTKR